MQGISGSVNYELKAAFVYRQVDIFLKEKDVG